MVSKALQAAAEGLGFTYAEKNPVAKSHMYGIYGGYLVSLYDSGNNKTIFISYYLTVGEEDDSSVRLLELSESLKSCTGDLNMTDYTVETDGLSCSVNCTVNDFLELLDRVVEMLKEHAVLGATHCSCCGNKLGKRLPKKLTADKNNFLLCEHCALDKLETASQTASSKADALSNKPGLGTLGAIGGGLLGVLAYFLMYYFVSPLFDDSAFEVRYIFSLLGFATAALVYFGFKLFSQKPTKGAYAIISSVSLVFVAVGQYIGSFAEYAKIQSMSILEAMKIPSMWLIHLRSTIDTTGEISYDSSTLELYNVSPLFYKLFCFSLLFALIGTIIFLLGMYDKGKVRKTPVEIETLRVSQASSQAND